MFYTRSNRHRPNQVAFVLSVQKRFPSDFELNGQIHAVEVEPRATLAEVLRDDLHMTGTKVVEFTHFTVRLPKILRRTDRGYRNQRPTELARRGRCLAQP